MYNLKKKNVVCFFVSFFLISVLGQVTVAQPSQRVDSSKQGSPQKSIVGLFYHVKDATVEPARRMRGSGFKWDHQIQVALPPSYHNSDQLYPVLWVTDGLSSFDQAVRAIYGEVKKYIPEMIVVGVGVPPDEEEQNLQRRPYEFSPSKKQLGFDGLGGDLLKAQLTAINEQRKIDGKPLIKETGGAPKFLNFLVDELRPVLSQDYRMSGDHTLFGDSGGGLFCTYTLLARPKSFSKYICGSPSLYAGNFELFRMEEQYAQEHDDMKAAVFFGAGEAEILEGGTISGWGVLSSMARMAEILRLREYPSLELHVRIFPGEEHISVIPLNLGWGLRTLWKK